MVRWFVCPTVSMVTTGYTTGLEKTLLEPAWAVYSREHGGGESGLHAEHRLYERVGLRLEVRLLRVLVHTEQLGAVGGRELLDVGLDVSEAERVRHRVVDLRGKIKR